MKNNLRLKTTSILIILLYFILFFSSNGNSIYISNSNIVKDHNQKSLISNSLTCDLKIKKSGEDWQDISVSAKTGNTLEFKGTVQSNNNYKEVYVSFLLSNEDLSIFDYVELSASPIPSLNEGVFFGDDDAVLWVWFDVESGWSEDMTFKAKIKSKGTIDIFLNVVGIIDEEEEDECEDSVKVVAKNKGAAKDHIMNINFQNPVLSYIFKNCKFSSLIIKFFLLLKDPYF